MFFQKVPQELPEAPASKRLVAPVPFVLPPPAPAVAAGVASFAAAPAAAAVEVRRGCSSWKAIAAWSRAQVLQHV